MAVSAAFLQSSSGKRTSKCRVKSDSHAPFAIPSSPAVSSARVASLGKWSSTTDAAIVMGSVASASGSGGAEEGEGGDGDAVGDGEAMVVGC